MSFPLSDLLFGLVAMRLDFVNEDQFLAGVQAWVSDKNVPLADIFVRQDVLDVSRRSLLEAVVAEHVAAHDNDTDQCFVSLSLAEPIKTELARLEDADVSATMERIPSTGFDDTVVKPAARQHAATSGQARPETSNAANRFQVLRSHAKGGIGEVFVARDDELNREVALKEIRPRHADEHESRLRFLQEAEITGRLEHPGIVPVYGLGSYEDGRPYYAMRFVHGENLWEAIQRFHNPGQDRDVRSSGIEFRNLLNRFIDVCQAIQFAHSRGILHRDIKPGNVMLGEYGETLVVDWGLAKPFGPPVEGAAADPRPSAGRDADRPAETEVGAIVGTPAYMSPEQASGRVDELGPATDVYSLGATLYAVLVGAHPFANRDGGPRLSPDELLERVRSNHLVAPRAAKPDVPAPLDAICRKAMAGRPEDRYASAEQLVDDVERYLADEPVEAFDEPIGVRARRWVKNHSRLVTALAATLVVGVVSLGATAAVVARKNDQLEIANTHEQAAKEKAHEALGAMCSTVIEEWLASRAEILPEHRRFLEQALEYYEGFAAETGRDDHVTARVAYAFGRVGDIQERLGRPEEARRAYVRALADQAALVDANPHNREYLRNLVLCEQRLGSLCTTLGDLPTARKHLLRAVELSAGQLGEHGDDETRLHVGARQSLASVCKELGDWDRAESELRVAVGYASQLVDRHPQRGEMLEALASCRISLGLLLKEAGEVADAESEYRLAIELIPEADPSDRASRPLLEKRASALYSLSTLLEQEDRDEEARSTLQQALEVYRGLANRYPSAPEYRNHVGHVRFALGLAYSHAGRLSDAEQEYRASEAIFSALADAYPEDPRHISGRAQARNNLSFVLARAGQLAESAQLAERAVQDRLELRTRYPEMSARLTEDDTESSNLASSSLARGDLAAAEAASRSVVRQREKLSERFPRSVHHKSNLASSLSQLAVLLMDSGQVAEAEKAFQGQLSVYRELVARFPDSRQYRKSLANALTNFGVFLTRLERYDDSEAAIRESIELLHQLHTERPEVSDVDETRLAALLNLGVLLSDRGEEAEVVEAYRDAIAVGEALVERFPELQKQKLNLARVRINLASRPSLKPRESLELLEDANRTLTELVAVRPEEPEFRMVQTKGLLAAGSLHQSESRLRDAARSYESAVTIVRSLVASHADNREYREVLVKGLARQAALFRGKDKHAEAVAALEEAVSVATEAIHAESGFPSDVELLAACLDDLAASLLALDRPDDAAAAAIRGIQVRESLVAAHPDNPAYRYHLARACNRCGGVLDDCGRKDEAASVYEKGVEIYRAIFTTGSRVATEFDLHVELSGLLVNLAQIKDPQDGIALLREAEPHHQAALTAQPLHPEARQFYRNNRFVLCVLLFRTEQRGELAVAAEQLSAAATEPRDVMVAASGFGDCILFARAATLSQDELAAEVNQYQEQMLRHLRRAAQVGYRDREGMLKDPLFDPVRDTAAFAEIAEKLAPRSP